MNDGPRIKKPVCSQVGTGAQTSNSCALPTTLCHHPLSETGESIHSFEKKAAEYASGYSESSFKTCYKWEL